MTESQLDQQQHQLRHYHSNDAPASAVSNENSNDIRSPGVVGASTAGNVSKSCETVHQAHNLGRTEIYTHTNTIEGKRVRSEQERSELEFNRFRKRFDGFG